MVTTDSARELLTAYLAHERESLAIENSRAEKARKQQETAQAKAAECQERIESFELALERLA